MTAFVDAHVHPPVSEFFDGPAARFLPGLRDRLGLALPEMDPVELVDYYRSRDARAVLLGWDAESAYPSRSLSSADVAEIVALAPSDLWGLGAVDPSKGAAAVAQVHQASRLGLAGISLYPAVQGRGPRDRSAFPVFEAACEHDLICLIHVGATIFGAGRPGGDGVMLEHGRPVHVDAVAARLPSLRIVLAAGGTLWLDEALEVAMHKSNVYLALGRQPPSSLSAEAVEAIEGPLADRVVFGSGFPFAEPEAWIAEWDKLGLAEAVTRKVLCDNALALFSGSA